MGHGACYAYNVTPPRPDQFGIITFPTGPGTGVLPYPITGDGEAVTCGGVLHCGDTVTFPRLSDYSIAITQAMAQTSYPVAQTALGELAASLTPFGSPVAIATQNGNDRTAPMPMFKIEADGSLNRGTLTPVTGLGDARFSGWTKIADGTLLLKSVAAALNADGRVQVFGLDRTGRLFTQWQQKAHDDTSWSAWAQLDGFAKSITVARNRNGTLQLFATDSDGKVMTTSQVPNGDYDPHHAPSANFMIPAVDNWTPWKSMGTITMTQLSAVRGDLIGLAGVTSAGEVWTISQKSPNATDPSVSGGWSAWTKLPATTRPARSISFTNVPVTATLDDDSIVELINNQWQTVPGSARYLATANGVATGQYYMLGRDAAGNTLLNASLGLWSDWYCNLTTDVARTCSINVKPHIAYPAANGHLGAVTPDGLSHDTGAAVKPGTSPASTNTNNGVETAYVGSDGLLYQIASNTNIPIKSGGGLAVAAGTDPAITSDGHGFWEIAFAGTDGHVWTVDSGGRVIQTAGLIAAGTSPSITYINTNREFNPDAGPRIVYNGSNGHLHWINAAGTDSMSGFAVARGTSPTVASASNDTWEILFQNSPDGRLITFASNGQAADTQGFAAPRTRPAITAVPGSGYWAAVQGLDGLLYTLAPGGAWTSHGLSLLAGTSPSLTNDGFGGWEIAFHSVGDADHLWTYDSTGKATNTNYTMAGNTSPAIAIAQQ